MPPSLLAAIGALSLASTAGLQQRPASPADLTLAEKQFGLARVWAAIERDYVNFDRMPLDWDSAFVATIPEVDRAASTADYYRVLTRLVAAVGDGHTRISWPRSIRSVEARNLPLRTRLVEGRVVVMRVANDSLYAAGVRAGMEVLEIDGEPALEYGRRHVMPYQASSTKQDRLLRTYDYELFRGPAEAPIRLVLTDLEGDTLRLEASRRLRWDRSEAQPLVDLRILPANVAHLRLRNFESAEVPAAFDSIYPKILASDGLIIDIRDNGGGSSAYGYHVLGHLVDRPFRGTDWYSRHHVPKIAAGSPGASYYLNRRRTYSPAAVTTYPGPVILLINEATFSAAEDFAAAFDALNRGSVVGTASGGSSGEPLLIHLPGGGTLRVCTERNTYPDGREFVGVGVVPDIQATPTIQGIRAGRDEVLEAALRVLEGEG